MSDAGPIEPAHDDTALHPLAGGKLLHQVRQPDRLVDPRTLRTRTDQGQDLRARQCVRAHRQWLHRHRAHDDGRPRTQTLEMRRDFQRMMKVRYSDMIEDLTGRKVLAFLSQAHVEPDLTIEMFLMDGPLAGFGALELVDPGEG